MSWKKYVALISWLFFTFIIIYRAYDNTITEFYIFFFAGLISFILFLNFWRIDRGLNSGEFLKRILKGSWHITKQIGHEIAEHERREDERQRYYRNIEREGEAFERGRMEARGEEPERPDMRPPDLSPQLRRGMDLRIGKREKSYFFNKNGSWKSDVLPRKRKKQKGYFE